MFLKLILEVAAFAEEVGFRFVSHDLGFRVPKRVQGLGFRSLSGSRRSTK